MPPTPAGQDSDSERMPLAQDRWRLPTDSSWQSSHAMRTTIADLPSIRCSTDHRKGDQVVLRWTLLILRVKHRGMRCLTPTLAVEIVQSSHGPGPAPRCTVATPIGTSVATYEQISHTTEASTA